MANLNTMSGRSKMVDPKIMRGGPKMVDGPMATAKPAPIPMNTGVVKPPVQAAPIPMNTGIVKPPVQAASAPIPMSGPSSMGSSRSTPMGGSLGGTPPSAGTGTPMAQAPVTGMGSNLKKGGAVKKAPSKTPLKAYKAGGVVKSSGASRGDGCAVRGRTKGKYC